VGLFFAALITGVSTLPTEADPLKTAWASTRSNGFDVVFDAIWQPEGQLGELRLRPSWPPLRTRQALFCQT